MAAVSSIVGNRNNRQGFLGFYEWIALKRKRGKGCWKRKSWKDLKKSLRVKWAASLSLTRKPADFNHLINLMNTTFIRNIFNNWTGLFYESYSCKSASSNYFISQYFKFEIVEIEWFRSFIITNLSVLSIKCNTLFSIWDLRMLLHWEKSSLQ